MTTEINYCVVLRKLSADEGGGWYVEIPDLPGCWSDGETPHEALDRIEEAKQLWLETVAELGRPIPEPRHKIDNYSGKFTLRIPKSLHRDLTREADLEGISLNQYVQYILSERHVQASMQRDNTQVTTVCEQMIERYIGDRETNR